MPQETSAGVNQERRCHSQVIVHPHRMSGGGEITILRERNWQPVRAVEMRTEIFGVVERDFAFASEVLIHLDGRYDFVGVGKIGLVPVVENPWPGCLGDERLD